jgi:transcription termination/antitermination protein NusA
MNQELVRIVDNIAKDKNIDKESIFTDLEDAMVSAIRKDYGDAESDITVVIDRENGTINAAMDGESIDIRQLGRIAAQTAKQVMIQKIKADERSSVFAEFSQRKGEIVSGTAVRYEGGSVIINLNNRTEAIMPKSEQISGESHHPSERVRGLILDVREVSSQVKIILSRTHPDFIRRLFELEVPEVTENIVEIKSLAREAGYRTKISVISNDDKVDAVGACVGIRGSRIKSIVDELGGEKIDIVRWSDSSQTLIANSLMPAKVSEIALCFELNRATVVVDEDQLSLAIGKHGQNVRLAARLTGWDIDILTPEEYNKEVEVLTSCIEAIEDAKDTLIDKLLALGILSVMDVEEVGAGPLVKEIGLTEELAAKIVEFATEKSKQKLSEEGKTQAHKVLKKEQKKAEDPNEQDTKPQA